MYPLASASSRRPRPRPGSARPAGAVRPGVDTRTGRGATDLQVTIAPDRVRVRPAGTPGTAGERGGMGRGEAVPSSVTPGACTPEMEFPRVSGRVAANLGLFLALDKPARCVEAFNFQERLGQHGARLASGCLGPVPRIGGAARPHSCAADGRTVCRDVPCRGSGSTAAARPGNGAPPSSASSPSAECPSRRPPVLARIRSNRGCA
jgi:hypothetical protein